MVQLLLKNLLFLKKLNMQVMSHTATAPPEHFFQKT